MKELNENQKIKQDILNGGKPIIPEFQSLETLQGYIRSLSNVKFACGTYLEECRVSADINDEAISNAIKTKLIEVEEKLKQAISLRAHSEKLTYDETAQALSGLAEIKYIPAKNPKHGDWDKLNVSGKNGCHNYGIHNQSTEDNKKRFVVDCEFDGFIYDYDLTTEMNEHKNSFHKKVKNQINSARNNRFKELCKEIYGNNKLTNLNTGKTPQLKDIPANTNTLPSKE